MNQIDNIVYHADCADGMAAAWVARSFVKITRPDSIINLIPLFHNEKAEDKFALTPPGTEVHLHILDITIPFESLLAIRKKTGIRSLTYLDHHVTGADDVSDAQEFFSTYLSDDRLKCVYRNGDGISGATLAWEHYFPGRVVPAAIRAVADRDTWTFAIPCSKAFHAYAVMAIDKAEEWDYVFDCGNYSSIVHMGRAILRYTDNVAKRYSNPIKQLPIMYGEHKGAFVNVNRENVSDTCQTTLEDAPDLKFVICFQWNPTYYKFDFRSRKGEDAFHCANIAKLFGGGGHAPAAGVEIPHGSPALQLLLDAFGIKLS